MDEQYLSEDIIIRSGYTYYQDKLIKRHNWHLKLEDLGWSKLSKEWIHSLNKLHNPYPNNSLFGCLECGDDGDCLFHCVATSLNTVHDNFYDSSDIRRLVADSISHEQFDNIIICYRSMKDLDDFDETWDPYEIDTLDKFRRQLMEPGHSYWGDHLIIQLITQVFNLNLFILTQNEWMDVYKEYPLATKYDSSKNTLILLHENNTHFKLIGHFQNVMITHFSHETLPLEIKKLYHIV